MICNSAGAENINDFQCKKNLIEIMLCFQPYPNKSIIAIVSMCCAIMACTAIYSNQMDKIKWKEIFHGIHKWKIFVEYASDSAM